MCNIDCVITFIYEMHVHRYVAFDMPNKIHLFKQTHFYDLNRFYCIAQSLLKEFVPIKVLKSQKFP